MKSIERELVRGNLRGLLIFITLSGELTKGYAGLQILSTLLLNIITRADRIVTYRTIANVFTVTYSNRQDRRRTCMQWIRCCTNKRSI